MPAERRPITFAERERLGKNIYKGRNIKNITQHKLAIEVGTTPKIISEMERPPRYMLTDVFTIVRIAKAFDTTVRDLLMTPNDTFLEDRKPSSLRRKHQDDDSEPYSKRNAIPESDKLRLAKNIFYHRDLLDLFQGEFSKLINISQQMLSNFETAKMIPSVFICLRIAELCETTVEDLCFKNHDNE